MSTTTGFATIPIVVKRSNADCNLNNEFSTFIAGGLAAFRAVTITHGFEIVKIQGCAFLNLQFLFKKARR